MRFAHPNLFAAALFGLFVFVYLWPVLVGGKILSPIADLYGVVPWQHSAPSDVAGYTNSTLSDLPLVDYPWRVLVRELLREGTFPAWNPYVLGGIPLYSNPQTGLFSAFNLPLWILPLTYALGVSAALKLLAGAFGTYLLARQLRLGFLPGLLAGVSFGFAAINITWLAHETLPGVVVALPWAIWLMERIFERGRPGDALALALALAVGLGGGHPGMQVHLLLIAALYAPARAACAGAGTASSPSRLRALGLIGGGLVAGVLLMAFMLVPEVRASHGTVGVLARQAGSLPGARMPLAAIETVIFPDRWGRPSAFETPLDPVHNPFGLINYNERTFYAGVVALLLACVGLVSRDAWRRKAPFALLALLGLAIPLDAPGLHWLATRPPVLDSVSPQRLHFAFELAVAVLAAFGLQSLLDAPAQARRRLAVPLVALAIGIYAVATAGAQPGDVGRTLKHFLSGADYPRSGVLALTSIAWYLLFVLAVGGGLLLAWLRPRWRVGIAVAIVALGAADAYHFAHGYQPMGPASKVIPPVTPAIAYLERHRADGRIAGLSAFPNDWPLVYGLADVRGYDPPQPTRRMLGLWRLANPEQLGWRPLEVPVFDRAAVGVLGALGARYWITGPELQLAAPSSLEFRTVYRGPDATVTADARAAPRALIPTHVRVTPSERATRATIAEGRFDPRTTVAVEADQPGIVALDGLSATARSPSATGDSLVVVRRQDARVTLHARLSRRRLVVLNETLMDGWRVRVDGHAAPALHVDDVMRGVIVPAGRHEIVWSYAVPGLRLGVLVSLATIVLLLVGAISLAARGRGVARTSDAARRG